MNEKILIYGGLFVFCAVVTFPFWYNLGNASVAPEILLSAAAKEAQTCVADKSYMKNQHMQILNIWREDVVRQGTRSFQGMNGKMYTMSLSSGKDSCMGCHTNRSQFCDRCHTYASVNPYCWDCHITPKEIN
ncbi:MAG: sulfate reduction electron transfer complex DsrMKJOP subunit DsrJ [Desulfobacterales bacterium]|nr:sulfate reduction electron transfer complex DsrMKJOP subunit DsrJ [Desulfobacterales bacterium]